MIDYVKYIMGNEGAKIVSETMDLVEGTLVRVSFDVPASLGFDCGEFYIDFEKSPGLVLRIDEPSLFLKYKPILIGAFFLFVSSCLFYKFSKSTYELLLKRH